MGRKLDILLGRKFKPTKLTATVNLAVSRIATLKKHRQARLTVARSDIIDLLKLNHHEHALSRVDQVIKEQNMLDVFVMVDGYCHLLLQMVNLIEKQKDCPDELKEAVSSLLYASPRCGEFPELQELRSILTSRYGKEFVHGATELRSNCGVNTRMILKLSPRQSSLETRMKILQEIADEIGVVLNLKDSSPSPSPKLGDGGSIRSEIDNNSRVFDDGIDEVLSFSESRNGKKKYRDVEDAAQAAFESAANAAAAARAAVELSRSRSFGSDNSDSPNSRPRKVIDSNDGRSRTRMENEKTEYESESEKEGEIESSKKNNSGTEDEIDEFSSSRESGFDSGKSESGIDEGMKIDFTRMPMSVRTKRVYVR